MQEYRHPYLITFDNSGRFVVYADNIGEVFSFLSLNTGEVFGNGDLKKISLIIDRVRNEDLDSAYGNVTPETPRSETAQPEDSKGAIMSPYTISLHREIAEMFLDFPSGEIKHNRLAHDDEGSLWVFSSPIDQWIRRALGYGVPVPTEWHNHLDIPDGIFYSSAAGIDNNLRWVNLCGVPYWVNSGVLGDESTTVKHYGPFVTKPLSRKS